MGTAKIAKKAKTASIQMAAAKPELKNRALADIAKALKQQSADIISANQRDLAEAEKNRLAGPLLKRL